MPSVNIPFPGFYESLYSGAIDHEEESFIEYRCDEYEKDNPDNESAWPVALKLDGSEYVDILMMHTEYSAAYLTLAQNYVETFDYNAGQALNMERHDWRPTYNLETRESGKERIRRPSMFLKFEEMTSPRYYNFETDRLFVTVPLRVIRELFKRSEAESHATLSTVIRERFTSRSGFHSHYSNDLDDWLEKPLADWDHNEYGTLLLAALQSAGFDADGDDERWRLYEGTCGDEGASQAWERAVKWDAFEAARTEARLDKFRDWLESDEEAAKRWAAAHPDLAAIIGAEAVEVPPARDPNTLDMFEGNDSHA